MSAPELLALLLCASFCVSILVIAQNSGKGQSGSLTPVYEAASPSNAHNVPWEQSGGVDGVDGEAGLQQRTGFAAKVLPFIAATSAGGILRGADTLWGPSERNDGAPSAGKDPKQSPVPGQEPPTGEFLWPAVVWPLSKGAQTSDAEHAAALSTFTDSGSSEASGSMAGSAAAMAHTASASEAADTFTPAQAMSVPLAASDPTATGTLPSPLPRAMIRSLQSPEGRNCQLERPSVPHSSFTKICRIHCTRSHAQQQPHLWLTPMQ